MLDEYVLVVDWTWEGVSIYIETGRGRDSRGPCYAIMCELVM